jgi:PAS domain S-box-containing protein
MTNHYEAIFQYATMGIVVTDARGVITNINPFALTEFGYEKEELMGQQIEALIPSRFRAMHVHDRENYTHNPQNRAMGLGLDLYARRKDGSEFPVEVSLGNYENSGNKYIIAFLSNISVRKETDREIEKLNNELEEIVEQRTHALLATMHELER